MTTCLAIGVTGFGFIPGGWVSDATPRRDRLKSFPAAWLIDGQRTLSKPGICPNHAKWTGSKRNVRLTLRGLTELTVGAAMVRKPPLTHVSNAVGHGA